MKSRVLKTELVNWKELKVLQQSAFKDLPLEEKEKLKCSLEVNGFIDPFKLWEDKKGNIWCLDGKHRIEMIAEMQKEGRLLNGKKIDDLLEGTFIFCESKKDAAKLVLIYSSFYAKITQDGLNEFLTTNDIDYLEVKEFVNFPEFSEQRFEQKFDFYNVNDAEEPEVAIDDLNIIVKTGDIFILNNHRIICGSFKNSEDVKLLMNGELARQVNCDPPYNLPANFFTNKDEQRHKDFAMGSGEMSDDEFVEFLGLIMKNSIENSLPGALHYIYMDWRHVWHMTEASRRIYGNPKPKQMCVWNKDMMANGSFYRAKQELCFVFESKQAKSLWNKDLLDNGGFYKDNDELCFIFKNGDSAKHLSHLELKDRIRTNVWNYQSATSSSNPDRFELKNHPTPKPVVMIADSILDTTNPGDIVIDWFLGSGTCLIACEHTGRKGRFTEIEPKYVQSDVIRYINYCKKRGIEVKFTHENGNLTLNDFLNGSKN